MPPKTWSKDEHDKGHVANIFVGRLISEKLRRKPVFSKHFRSYNSEGYALRLSGNVSLEDEDIMVDRRVRLRPLSIDRISFLRN